MTYLDTATFGLPPRRSLVALQQALAQWRAGIAEAVAYDLPVDQARSSYAQLVGVDPSAVAVGSQVSVFAGLIAANLPDGSEVLTASGDFTSILFPFYAQSGRGIRIREVPLDRIADCITSRTTLVAVSAVQSADGRAADLDAVHAASHATGARVLLDTTQAVGWLPVDASRFACTACGGYKWLLSPRGTAYFTRCRSRDRDISVPAYHTSHKVRPSATGERASARHRSVLGQVQSFRVGWRRGLACPPGPPRPSAERRASVPEPCCDSAGRPPRKSPGG